MNQRLQRLIRCFRIMHFRIFVVLAFAFIVEAKTLSITYSVEGDLTYEGHGLGEPQGYKGETYKWDFEVLVDDCKWTIKTIEIGNTNFSYFLTTYDGTNVTYLDRPSLGAFTLLRSNLRPGVSNLFQSCVVESVPVPRTMSLIPNAYPWLAFASGYYLGTVTNESVWDIHPLNIHQALFAGR